MEKNRFKLDEGGLIEQGVQDSNKLEKIKHIEETMAETEAVFGTVKEMYNQAMALSKKATSEQGSILVAKFGAGVIESAKVLCGSIKGSGGSIRLSHEMDRYYKMLQRYSAGFNEELKSCSQSMTEVLNSIYDEYGDELENLTTQDEGAGI